MLVTALLLVSCTADDMRLQNENDRFAEKDDFVFKTKDTIYNDITTVATDSLCNGEYEPPIVPKPPIRN